MIFTTALNVLFSVSSMDESDRDADLGDTVALWKGLLDYLVLYGLWVWILFFFVRVTHLGVGLALVLWC